MSKHAVVTGAFGNSGGPIAQGLLARGWKVRTLTNSPHRPSPLQGRVDVRPLDFDDGEGLRRALAGAELLVNNYWVRYEEGGFRHDRAVGNTLKLFAAAKAAKVRRVVHVSITHAEAGSPYSYFSGKGRLEEALRGTGIPHSILRPGVLFGEGQILVNNVAWLLRHAPVFGLFGGGGFRLRPIHVDDFCALALRETRARGRRVINAVGPERPSYRDWVASIAAAVGSRARLLAMPPRLAWAAGLACGWLRRDVVLNWQEVAALMEGKIDAAGPAAGRIRFSTWIKKAAPRLGLRYLNELERRRDRRLNYSVQTGSLSGWRTA